VPGGEAGALRLSLIAVAVALLAVIASEILTRRIGRSGRLT
jgi:molybdate transport system permease protein